MRIPKSLRILFVLAMVSGMAFVAYQTRSRWLPLLSKTKTDESHSDETPIPIEEPKVLKLSEQARKNLGLVSKSARSQSYWRTIQIPGSVVDRPGQSDRGVTSPAVGVVTEIHAFPGETVRPGEQLFTLRLFSEYLQNTQKEFFAATNEIQLLNAEHARLVPVAQSGGVPQAKLIDLNNQISRQQALIQSHRQDLLTRGLAPEQIEQIASGEFVSTVDVVAPPLTQIDPQAETPTNPVSLDTTSDELPAYEVHDLEVELGQQVQAGQLLAMLADHRCLYVVGHAFKREAPWLERAAQNGWPVTIEFAEDDPEGWPKIDQRYEIRFLANTVDTENRTFDFFIPLTNQSRTYQKGEETFLVWRFRPGQRVRLHVPVEEMQNVLVLPSEGVVREGPEAFVFQQNGDLFNRIPVHVLHEDRNSIVIANDGSVTPGLFLAQNSAASLNRVLKAQAASGMRADVHVHADGTVHAAH